MDKFVASLFSQIGSYGEELTFVAERFYSRVYRTSGRVLKLITPHLKLQPGGFKTRSEASAFATQIFIYIEELAGLSVPVSPIDDTHIVVSGVPGTGQPFILMDVPDGGVSAEALLEQAVSYEFIRQLAHGMINSILHVLSQSRVALGGYPKVGIDPIGSNFVLRDNDIVTLTYVDFTAPRYFSLDELYRVEYPQPSSATELREATWLYYDPCGIVARWLTDCCRVRPDARDIFLDVLAKFLPADLWKSVRERLPSLWFAEGNWISALEASRGTVDLRDMACAIAATDGADPEGTKQWLQKFFQDSRHHPGQPLPEGRLEVLRQQLAERLSPV